MPEAIGIRWTIGAVHERGFEALRLSIWGAWRLFGDTARYAVCVNSIPLERARTRTAPLPARVTWHNATNDFPAWLQPCFDRHRAEGAGWKLAPVRFFTDCYELALDNDCILWALPAALSCVMNGQADRAILAEDVRPALGQFAALAGYKPRNAGIRGLPAGFDLEAALRETLRERERELGAPPVLRSELDEQGLQAAALERHAPPLIVRLDEVTLCSPFYPNAPGFGTCGAHFVGLNARHLPFDYYDRPADQWMTAHWERSRRTLQERVGLDA